MAKKEKKKPPENLLAHYKRLIDTIPELELKGVTTGYTSLNGHMFTFMSNEGELGIRLPKDAFEEFQIKFNTSQFMQYGTKMKGYVKVPEELISETEKLKEYLYISYEYIKTLKPK